MFKQTNTNRVLFPRTLTSLVLGVLTIATMLYGGFAFHPQPVYAATTDATVNFQARLQSSAGNVVPDGQYNIQFKLYDVTSGGTALWTESYYDSNGATAGNDNRVIVKNGYISVALGSQTAFPSTINWDQSLYMTMNIGGTTQTATPTYDGEMNPRLALGAVPYAFKAGQLAQHNATTGFTSTLSLLQPTVGDQNFQIADQGAAGTYTLCVQSSTTCGFAAATGSTAYIQNGTSPQTADFNITGAAKVGSLVTTSIDTAASGTLTVGSSSTTINIGSNGTDRTINLGVGSANNTVTIGAFNGTSSTTINSGTGGIALHATGGGGVSIEAGGSGFSNLYLNTNGETFIRTGGNSHASFQVQNSTGGEIFTVDSTDNQIKTCPACGAVVGAQGLTSSGALTLLNSGTTGTYVTPLGASISSKINIENVDPGAYGQLVALGLPSSAQSTSRALTLLDARTSAHQATLAVLSPDENNIGGFSWDGSNSIFGIKTNTSTVAINNSGGAGLQVIASGSNQVTVLGDGSTSNGVLRLNNSTNNNYAALQASSVSTTYVTTLASAAGTAGQCLTVASATSGAQTLGYGACGSATSLQGAYDASSSPASILLADAKNFVVTAADTSTDPSILFNLQCVTSCGSNGKFAIQNAGTDYFKVTSNSTIVIGGSTNNITFDNNGQYVLNGSSRRQKAIQYKAEYTNSVLDAGTGSNNTGTMTSSIDLTNRMNYYKWTTTQGSNQTYDIDLQVPLPEDFDGWITSPLAITAYTSNTTNGTVTLEARDSAGSVICNFVSVTPASTGTWATDNTSCGLTTGTYTPGDYMTIRIRMKAPASGDTRVGNLRLTYLSKY